MGGGGGFERQKYLERKSGRIKKKLLFRIVKPFPLTNPRIERDFLLGVFRGEKRDKNMHILWHSFGTAICCQGV